MAAILKFKMAAEDASEKKMKPTQVLFARV